MSSFLMNPKIVDFFFSLFIFFLIVRTKHQPPHSLHVELETKNPNACLEIYNVQNSNAADFMLACQSASTVFQGNFFKKTFLCQ